MASASGLFEVTCQPLFLTSCSPKSEESTVDYMEQTPSRNWWLDCRSNLGSGFHEAVVSFSVAVWTGMRRLVTVGSDLR